MRVLALDHGGGPLRGSDIRSRRSDVTPLPEVERPETKSGLKQIADLVEQRGAERVVVGLPLTLAGEEGEQAARARVFAEALREKLGTRWSCTTSDSPPGSPSGAGRGCTDSRAAAHLLESWLARAGAAAE